MIHLAFNLWIKCNAKRWLIGCKIVNTQLSSCYWMKCSGNWSGFKFYFLIISISEDNVVICCYSCPISSISLSEVSFLRWASLFLLYFSVLNVPVILSIVLAWVHHTFPGYGLIVIHLLCLFNVFISISYSSSTSPTTTSSTVSVFSMTSDIFVLIHSRNIMWCDIRLGFRIH